VLIGAGCEAWATVDPRLSVSYMSREPAHNAYNVAVDGSVITTTAHSSSGTNTRAVVERNVDGASIDQQVCATWSAPDQNQQPGLALKAQHHDGTQAITVTKNVWYGAVTVFNVHVMDTRWPVLYVQMGQQELFGLRQPGGPNPSFAKPYPWRACARTVGGTLTLKVWPTAEPEPSWGDPLYGYSIPVPPGWDTLGRPSMYMGHMGPNAVLRTSDVETTLF
jgi:hypothetical protein